MNKSEEIKIGVSIIRCKECERFNKGIEILSMFEWGPYKTPLLDYDHKDETILVNEDVLMSIIQMANRCQKPRKIKIVSTKEYNSSFKEE